MRAGMLLLGIALVALGGYTLARGLTYKEKERVLDMGPLKVNTETEHPVPPWVGGLAALAGVGIVFAGARKKGVK